MKKYILLLSFFTIFSLYAIRPFEGGDFDYKESEDATHIPAMILVEEGDVDESIEELEAMGVTVLRHRKNILLAYVPVDFKDNQESEGEVGDANGADRKNKLRQRKASLRKTKGVKKIEFSKPRQNRPTMNLARQFNDAYYINEGYLLPQPYTGKGVVVGVCDIGMDTRHPNFLNADQSECRIHRVVHYQEQQGLRDVYSTPEEIYEWQTDNADDWHATHVTGIAAGGNKSSNFQSLAPDADIVFTASQLSDVGLLAGVEDIIEYAKEVRKPAVINLSMGNYTGPHDGTSLFTQYLDLCAEDAIICLSAGNEGAGYEPHSMSYDFTDSKKELRVRTSDWGGTDYTGIAEVWGADDTPFSFQFYLRSSRNAGSAITDFDKLLSEDGEEVEWRISADPEDPDYNEILGKYFYEGYVVCTAGVSPLNGRYCATLEFELKSDYLYANNDWAEYWAALIVNGEPGTHVDVFCGGGSFLRQAQNFPEPDNNICISDLATGFKTISVGMMNNTDISDNGDAQPGSGYAAGDVCIHSSYGTLLDGRKLPMTVAPGAYVTSSISSVYLENHPEDIPYTDYQEDYNGNTVYWIGTLGTSMSCPYVVSVIANWLQAYPILKSEEAIEIIQKTNQISGYPDENNPRHGGGWLNPYKGIQEVATLSALKVGTLDAPDITLKAENGFLIVANPLGENLSLEIYNPAGMLIEKGSFNDTLGQYPLTHLPSGIYLLKVKNQTLKIKL